MGKFFNVDVVPDIVNGDISEAFGDIAGNDIVFDWTAVNVPKGGCMLRSVTAFVNAEDGAYGSGSLTDYELIFAKSVDGVAPPTMGVTNAAQTGCFPLRHHYIGSVMLDSVITKATVTNLAFGVGYVSGTNPSQDFNNGLPLVMDLEAIGTTYPKAGYEKLYVMGFQMATRNYNTGVIFDGTIDASAAPSTIQTVKTIDATKLFSVGDTVYVHDLDTQIPGTLTHVTATKLTFSETNSTVDIADGDEAINANPIRIKLGFEQ